MEIQVAKLAKEVVELLFLVMTTANYEYILGVKL